MAYWGAVKNIADSVFHREQKDRRKLLLISGSARSTTTALHNAFISSGLFKGILADDLVDRDPNIDQNLHTDEYYPSMKSAIAWSFAKSGRKKREFAREISGHITDLY